MKTDEIRFQNNTVAVHPDNWCMTLHGAIVPRSIGECLHWLFGRSPRRGPGSDSGPDLCEDEPR